VEYINGRELIDLLEEFPIPDLQPEELVQMLRKLPPRLYSIASSYSAFPDEVHVTVSALRYRTFGRDRKGVASTYFADRLEEGEKAPVYISVNPNFRLPHPSRPIIMVGPGTGIAPFRGFLQERVALKASSENWLFFGERKSTEDFYYKEYLEELQTKGMLKLNTAFSRDGAAKVYVQHRMYENRKQLWEWLDKKGAYLFICGDKNNMAKSVDEVLVRIASEEGQMSELEAKAYLSNLRKEKRIMRDVY